VFQQSEHIQTAFFYISEATYFNPIFYNFPNPLLVHRYDSSTADKNTNLLVEICIHFTSVLI